MKKIFTIIALLFSLGVFAQTGDDVVNALKSSNTSKFTEYFGNNVDVKLPQKTEMKNVAKADAATAGSSFFSANNITGFEVISQREMGGTMYIAGKLTGSSKSYNLTVMLKSLGNGLSVITVRIS